MEFLLFKFFLEKNSNDKLQSNKKYLTKPNYVCRSIFDIRKYLCQEINEKLRRNDYFWRKLILRTRVSYDYIYIFKVIFSKDDHNRIFKNFLKFFILMYHIIHKNFLFISQSLRIINSITFQNYSEMNFSIFPKNDHNLRKYFLF